MDELTFDPGARIERHACDSNGASIGPALDGCSVAEDGTLERPIHVAPGEALIVTGAYRGESVSATFPGERAFTATRVILGEWSSRTVLLGHPTWGDTNAPNPQSGEEEEQ